MSTDSATTFYSIEIDPKQVDDLLGKSPMSINGHSIKLSTECLDIEHQTVNTLIPNSVNFGVNINAQIGMTTLDQLDDPDDDDLSICDDDDEEEEGEIREDDEPTIPEQGPLGSEIQETAHHPVANLLDLDPPSEMSISPNMVTTDIIVCGQSTDGSTDHVASSGNEERAESSDNVLPDGHSTKSDHDDHHNASSSRVRAGDDAVFRLSGSQRDTLQNYKDNVRAYNVQIVELKRNLKAEEMRYNVLLQQIGGDGKSGDEAEKRALVSLREHESRLDHALSQREKELISIKNKLDRSETALAETRLLLEVSRKNERKSHSVNRRESDEWDQDRREYQRRMELLNVTNEKLKRSVHEMEDKRGSIKRATRELKEDNERNEGRWRRYQKELDSMGNAMVDRKEKMVRNKAEMQSKIEAMRAKLQSERSKHAQSKVLLKQTVNGIKTNLTAFNANTQKKDAIIYSLQGEIGQMQTEHPWLAKM